MDPELENIQEEEVIEPQEYIKLADGTEFDIEPGGYLGRIVHIAADEQSALAVITAFSKANIAHVEFWRRSVVEGQDDEKTGEYDDLIFASQPTRQAEVDENDEPTGRIIVVISLREETELEKRVARAEEDITNVEVALADVYEMIV